MKIKNGISPAILVAATSMLQQYIPDLTPTNLVAALKAFETAPDETAKRMKRQSVEKPYTCNEVCELLGVSRSTVGKYLKEGRLRWVRLSPRVTRIDPESVRAALAGAVAADAAASEEI